MKIQLQKQHRKYEKYKNTGIPWISEVPEEWNIIRTKYFFKSHTGGVWGDEPNGDYNDLLCVRVADFDYSKLTISESAETLRNIPKIQHKSKMIRKWNLLIEKSGGGEKTPVGRAVLYNLDKNAVCSNFVEKAEINKLVDPRYISYLFFFQYQTGITTRSIKQTTGIQNLDLGNYLNEFITKPSRQEQITIANYLDEKTALLDQIIVSKRKQIELLKEKRNSLINRAVTRGLDENVEMKDSGVEWIGEVPKGWEVRKLKYCANILNGYAFNSDDYQDVGLGILRIGDVGQSVDFSSVKRVPFELRAKVKKFRVRKGDILLALTGATIGKSSVYNSDEESYLNQRVGIIRGSKVVLSEFLTYFVATDIFQENIKVACFGGAQENIGKPEVSNIFMSCPSIQDQKSVVAYLDYEIQKIDQTIVLVEKSITLLEDYKTSLISNVVTGKIKICDHY